MSNIVHLFLGARADLSAEQPLQDWLRYYTREYAARLLWPPMIVGSFLVILNALGEINCWTEGDTNISLNEIYYQKIIYATNHPLIIMNEALIVLGLTFAAVRVGAIVAPLIARFIRPPFTATPLIVVPI